MEQVSSDDPLLVTESPVGVPTAAKEATKSAEKSVLSISVTASVEDTAVTVAGERLVETEEAEETVMVPRVIPVPEELVVDELEL